MICCQGHGVSKGLAKGPVCFYTRTEAAAAPTAAAGSAAVTSPATEVSSAARANPTATVNSAATVDPADEKRRLADALVESVRQLNTLAETARKKAGEEAAQLFEAHALLLRDEDFTDCMSAAIENERCTAEHAVELARDQFAALLAATGDDYMQARADDVRDVARRMLDHLAGGAECGIVLREPAILAANDLSPSETLLLDKSKLLGLLTQGGSAGSHTAILARMLGIPAVCGLGEALGPALNGCIAIMDGETGTVTIEPDAAALAAFEAARERQQTLQAQTEAVRGLPDVTPDGHAVNVYCNIATPDDLAAVLANDGRGIGLFRSEFLYMAADGCPTEEEQFRAYRAVAAAMDGKRVVIRTLDIGADKQLKGLPLPQEENPALGLRGIRISLERPELFRTQLRALYRASAYGNVAILLPMITSVWEVRACRRICQSVMDELEAEGIPCRRDTKLGIMIETPAAVLIAAELAREADLFSVGTNDLTQYLLACDRRSGHLEKFRDAHHPAVLRAVKLAADAAHAAGIPIGICGDLAADLPLTETFLAMGIDSLSVPPAMVLPLRAVIRRTDVKNCTLEKLQY